MTHLVHWKGGLTGIPRTIDEIALRLKDQKNVEFVVWEKHHRRFVPLDINYYYDVQAPRNREFFKYHTVDKSKKKLPAYERIVRRFLYELPVLARLATLVRRILGKIKRMLRGLRKMEQLIYVTNHDIFFIPNGQWDDDGYMNAVLDYKKAGAKLLFICYDILPITVPQFSGQWKEPLEQFTRRVTSQCDLVFCISKHTEKDLIDWLGANNLRIPSTSVIRLGDSFANDKPSKPKDKRFIESGLGDSGEDFILTAGTIEARKNHTLLYYTYKLAKSKNIQLPKLVIAGRQGYRTRDITHILEDDPEINKNIILLFDVSDEELSWLYQNCKYTVYPSFYEGWGLPIAESIAKGVPCICSNTSSMVEVAPGIPTYFNPSSPEELLQAITSFQNKKIYNDAKKKVKKYVPITWDLTFDQVMQSPIMMVAKKSEK